MIIGAPEMRANGSGSRLGQQTWAADLGSRRASLSKTTMPTPGRCRHCIGFARRPPLLGDHFFSKCVRQAGLSWDFFEVRHAAMRSMLGIAELHRLMTSLMQSDRCAAVGLNPANAAVEKIPTREQATAAPKSLLRTLIMIESPLCLKGTCPPDQLDAGSPCCKSRRRAVTAVNFLTILRRQASKCAGGRRRHKAATIG